MSTELVLRTSPTPEALRARLADARLRAASSLVELETELRDDVRARLDPRTSVRAHPAAWIGAAFLLGFLLGSR